MKTPYPKGLVISDADFAALKIDLDAFHGEWNYSIQRWLPVEVVSLFANRPALRLTASHPSADRECLQSATTTKVSFWPAAGPHDRRLLGSLSTRASQPSPRMDLHNGNGHEPATGTLRGRLVPTPRHVPPFLAHSVRDPWPPVVGVGCGRSFEAQQMISVTPVPKLDGVNQDGR